MARRRVRNIADISVVASPTFCVERLRLLDDEDAELGRLATQKKGRGRAAEGPAEDDDIVSLPVHIDRFRHATMRRPLIRWNPSASYSTI